jgi:hypothetical protein
MVPGVGVELLCPLQTRKLFISRSAQSAIIARIAGVRYTAGTRADCLASYSATKTIWSSGLPEPEPDSDSANKEN